MWLQQGHDFRCVPKSVASIFEQCLDKNPEKVAGKVEITTQKIGKALGLSSIGTPYDDKVTTKDLSEEDHNVYKFFQEVLPPAHIRSERDPKSPPHVIRLGEHKKPELGAACA
ncbi:hypothetical protein PIB30_099601 [Stylosanthes scabra]|uniref:Uncharacterized protein n=1 Tax=Stylosanthes scabra TaxID=79078 RepID=A0ABU6XTP6_9FABA|nr:hypothetical protein [Stylosanthes scabra]